MVTNTKTSKSPQWLALHFQHLALDQHNRGLDQKSQDKPQAISEKLAGRQCIVDFNQAAEHAGTRIGMPVAAALSLLDSLQVSVRDPRTEQAALKRLAGWCYQYSSQVCIDGKSNNLLLEVAASERLFGHAETLAGRITTELEQLGYRAVSGIAPTPEAARLAATARPAYPYTSRYTQKHRCTRYRQPESEDHGDKGFAENGVSHRRRSFPAATQSTGKTDGAGGKRLSGPLTGPPSRTL